MPLQPKGRKNVLIGLSSIFLASLLAAGGMVERNTSARGTTVRMSSVSLDFAYPTPTVQPTIPVVVQKKADVPRSVVEPLKHEAAVSASPPPVITSTTSPVVGSTTLATHYTPRPKVCYDTNHVTRVPSPGEIGYDPRYTAAHLPCGTKVEVTGPVGSIVIYVWDHGPNCTCPERGLDLSPAAFLSVVGPLRTGIVSVRWRLVN